MNEENEKVSIVVTSCDAYRDLWDDFFALKEKNWYDCFYKTYLVSNNEYYENSKVETIKCGNKLNWTGRLKLALSKIDSKYIILLLEDYFISESVCNNEMEDIINLMEKEDIVYYKLENRGGEFYERYKEIPYIYKIKKGIKYGISLTTSVWNKNFLEYVLGEDDCTAWEFEIKRNQKEDCVWVEKRNMVCDSRNILKIVHMVQRGKFIRKSIKKLEKKGYKIKDNSRGKLSIYYTLFLETYGKLRKHRRIFNLVKRVLSFLGIKSISERYEEEILTNKYK